jgi:hypothetical protein
LIFRSNDEKKVQVDENLCKVFGIARRERAIGVVYSKENEHNSHYFSATLPYQTDLHIHIDKTTHLDL